MEQPSKKQRVNLNQPIDIIDTIVNNEITNTDVLNSHHYFQTLKSTETESGDTQIIRDYRNEHEEDEDYNEDSDPDTYPKINYSVVNWLFSTISNTKNNVLSNDLYIPHILKFKFITNKDILNNFLNQQIKNAYIMNNLLNSFPKITIAPIIVYRGVTDAFFNILQNNISRGQITFSCFLSTSLFIDTAKRFTFNLKHIMSIEIPTNTSLAYVSDKLEYMNTSFGVTGEAEVLIPMNATLVEISEPENDGEYTIHKFRLAGYLKETRNAGRLATAFVDKFSTDIFNKIDKKEEEEEEEEKDTPDSQESLVQNSFGGNKLFKITHNKTKKKRQRSNKNRSNKKRSGKNKKKRTNKKRTNKKRY